MFSERQWRVILGVRHAFDAYRKYAWGKDELIPESLTSANWGGGSGIGLTLIESLDTLWVTGEYDRFHTALEFLSSPNHTFAVDIEAGLFETTIRVLGGLLSAYELSGELVLLDKAEDIGSRLFRCLDGRPIPLASVNLKTLQPSSPRWLGNRQSLAEITTIQLEFTKLSHFTGIAKYGEAAQAVMQKVLSFMPGSLPDGLFPIYVHQSDGSPALDSLVTLGARGDSFYEYLVKQWVLTNRTEKWLEEAYTKTANGIVTRLLIQIDDHRALVAEAANVNGGQLEEKMDHLVCFVVGMLQLGKHGSTAARDDKAAGDIARTCYEMYSRNPTGLGTEIVRFRGSRHEMYPSPGAHHYIMRPEVMEAMFYQTRFHPEEYDVWSSMAWKMYEAMEKHLRKPDGWVGLRDATTVGGGENDKMESFFVAETLKYAFLCAADKHVAPTQLPLDEWVFNTEAHPLRILPHG
jgi:mannosyl-oligosaccharide alpha-1,2-mannosidase